MFSLVWGSFRGLLETPKKGACTRSHPLGKNKGGNGCRGLKTPLHTIPFPRFSGNEWERVGMSGNGCKVSSIEKGVEWKTFYGS